MRAQAGKTNRRVVALGAFLRRWNSVVAIVADGFVANVVMRQRDRTIGTGLDVAASGALNPRRKASAVEQQNDLSAVSDRFGDFLSEFLVDRTEAFSSLEVDSHVDRRYVGQR